MAQFAGFVYWLVTALSGFWCLTFLAHVAIAWIVAGPLETFGIIGTDDSQNHSRPTLPNQKGVEVLFKK
jgi:hypothetical protein